jgi:muconolactone delta-isomerase
VEFLVHIEVLWPADGDPAEYAKLRASEGVRASELAASGRLRRLWRIPGQHANWGLWEADNATDLHEAISSLPHFPWLSVEVHALAAHPSDPLRPGGR